MTLAAAFWISKLCPRRLQGDQAEPPPPSSRSMPSSPCVLAPGAWGGQASEMTHQLLLLGSSLSDGPSSLLAQPLL